MRQRWKIWVLVHIAVVTGLLWGSVFLTLDLAHPLAADLRGPLMAYAFFASVAYIILSVLHRIDLGKRLLTPISALTRDIRTLLDAKQIDRALREIDNHGLGQLPDAVGHLVDALRGARREVVRAMATATARVEQEKGWLEVILLELVREGVVLCSAEHRILLYNRPVTQLFRDSHVLGLGRSLFGLVAEAPVRHALERLEHRLQSGSRDLNTRFVCATQDSRTMLQARAALIIEPGGKASGYVLTLEDISDELEELQRNEAVRTRVTRDLRGPVASLRAAAENLTSFPDMEPEHRRAFQEVILNESATLSRHMEELAEEYRGRSEGRWPITEIYSPDLLGCLARHLKTSDDLLIHPRGEDHWLSGDSHSLMLALESLIRQIATTRNLRELDLEAGSREKRSWLEIQFSGDPVSNQELATWLEHSMSSLPGLTVGQVFEHHGSEPWCDNRDGGRSAIRIPLQAAGAVVVGGDKLPPRPEFYDFDMMFAHSMTGELADRPLKNFTYVVFDTETTGLKPAGGDEIISIAGVRVTHGRVLTQESFESLVNPGRPIPKDSIRFHGITDEKVEGQPSIEEVLPKFHEFALDSVLVAHNAAFDMKFLKLKEADCGIKFENPVVDTLLLSLLIEGSEEDHSLDGICGRLNLEIQDRHSALGDAMATAHVLVHLVDRLEAMGIQTFGQVMKASNMEAELRFRGGHF